MCEHRHKPCINSTIPVPSQPKSATVGPRFITQSGWLTLESSTQTRRWF